MAIPTTATTWADTMDPSDLVDYTVDFANVLDVGESISTYTITPLSESTLLGLTVNTTGGYSNSLVGSKITMWLSIASANQSDAAFSGAGTSLPIEVAIVTNSTPPRKRQRTVVVKVAQK